MSRREQAVTLIAALAILLAGVVIGASTAATRFTPAPPVAIDDGAIDFSTQPEGDQNG